MTASFWKLRFSYLDTTDDGQAGLLQLTVDDGPLRVRIDWGAVDALSGDPAVQVIRAPAFFPFALPGRDDLRAYADGSYTLRVTGIFEDGSRQTRLLDAFFDLNDALGRHHVGSGRDEAMAGGAGNDTFEGCGGNDWLRGGFGDDLLIGGAGNDLLVGGFGDDTLLGGAGDDWLFGEEGDNLMRGGAGSDFLLDGDGNSVLFGDAGSDVLYGGGGDDTLVGGAGADILWGDAVDDDEGNDGNDLLRGGDGADHLYGGGGNDTLDAGDGDGDIEYLFGEAGDDLLKGGIGFHRFEGGAGNDTIIAAADGIQDWFVYNWAAHGLVDVGVDRIIGFESGIDSFLFIGLDAAAIGAGRFAASLAEIADGGSWIVYDAQGRLWVDLNGTGAGELYRVATLVGAPTLSFADFVF